MLDGNPPGVAPKPSQQIHRAWSKAVKQASGFGPRGLWIAAGILLLGLIVAVWAVGVFKVKTTKGVIVLENVPENAVIEIDGETVTVTPKPGEPLKIEAQPGKHGVVVKRGNDVLLGESVTIESGKDFQLTARLEPVVCASTGSEGRP